MVTCRNRRSRHVTSNTHKQKICGACSPMAKGEVLLQVILSVLILRPLRITCIVFPLVSCARSHITRTTR